MHSSLRILCLASSLSFFTAAAEGGNSSSLAVVSGTHQLIESDVPIEIVYQAPPSLPIKGLLFLAHGCQHSATDWWPKSELCPQCIGLPVEKSIVSEALRRGYLALAVSSLNRKRRCWSDSDIPRAVVAIKWALERHSLKKRGTPIHLFGASSGGSFVGHLALKSVNLSEVGGAHNPFGEIKVNSAVIQISPLRLTGGKGGKVGGASTMPGLLFMHMARDEYMAPMITAFVQKSASPSIQEMVLAPKALSTTYFFDHGHLSREDSSSLVQALLTAGYIDTKGYLKEDPRGSSWRSVASNALPQVVPRFDSLVADESGISELLNLAWSLHEMSNEDLPRVFDFMKKMEVVL